MRVLLAGAAGFIGAHVARSLLRDGHEVVGFDNLNDAYDVRLKELRVSELVSHERFTLALCDITDRIGLADEWKRHGPFDAVVDLAARAGVRSSIEDPWIHLGTNVVGTLNLLDLSQRTGTRKVVIASSSSVYGRNCVLPYSEEQPVVTPMSPYAASKIGAEAMAHCYHHLYGLDISVLRYFTVYGPAGRPDMSPFRFIRWISEGETVIVFGDGSQSRDYTYVGDIARGTIAALRPLGFEVINLGSDAPVTLCEMVRALEEIVGKAAKVEYRPASIADVRATWACIKKAETLLNWKPNTSLREGLSRTTAWYRENRDLALTVSM